MLNSLLYNLLRLTRQGVGAIFGLSILMLLAPYWWIADLLQHFTLQYAILLFFALCTLLVIRRFTSLTIRPFWLALTGALLLWHAYPVVRFYFTNFIPQELDDEEIVSVMAVNVMGANANYNLITDEIMRMNPDILLVVEVRAPLMKRLKVLEGIYPHHIVEPRPDNFGIALYSRYPLSDSKIHHEKDWGFPFIEATIHNPKTVPIRFYGVHPVPPVGKALAKSNYEQIAALFKQLDNQSHVIVAGDFNNTPWSYSYRKWLADTELYNINIASLKGTWLPHLLGGLLIDHIFVKQLGVAGYSVGQDIGSDHRAIRALLMVPKRETDE